MIWNSINLIVGADDRTRRRAFMQAMMKPENQHEKFYYQRLSQFQNIEPAEAAVALVNEMAAVALDGCIAILECEQSDEVLAAVNAGLADGWLTDTNVTLHLWNGADFAAVAPIDGVLMLP